MPVRLTPLQRQNVRLARPGGRGSRFGVARKVPVLSIVRTDAPISRDSSKTETPAANASVANVVAEESGVFGCG
jgi:hypothetical protein